VKPDAGEILDLDGDEIADSVVRPEDVLTPEELRVILGVAQPGRERALLMTVVLTGLRAGEFLGLRWPDIDLETGQLHVRRKLTWAKRPGEHPWGKRYEPRFFRPKTKAGVRTIPMPPELVSELRRWRLQCTPSELDLVFPNVKGSPEHEKNVLQGVLWPVLKRAKVRRVSMKCLRHTFASILILKNTPVSEVQSYMGHATPAITLTVYTHWFKNRRTGALDRLAEELIPSIGQAR
jgi:integrase